MPTLDFDEKLLRSQKYGDVEVAFRADVIECLLSNGDDVNLDALTPIEFLSHYLHRNGMVRYSSSIIRLMESLGWTPPKL